MTSKVSLLTNRSILKISGIEAVPFLQGLVTNDMGKCTSSQAIYAALLTPQGRFLHDLFIVRIQDGFLLDVERERYNDLVKKLNLYKLRSQVLIEDLSNSYEIFAQFGAYTPQDQLGAVSEHGETILYVDPRLAEAGLRIIAKTDLITSTVDFEIYDQHRLQLGLPDGSRDMIPEKAIPLECRLDHFNGISFNKGCYLGQELTSRTKHQGLVRKELRPLYFKHTQPPQFNEDILVENQVIGSMRSSNGNYGLGLIRLEFLDTLSRL